MPVAVTYPGVYIEEISSGVRSISGVATSIAAFVDAFSAGPMNQATRVLGFADFEKQFGGLSATSEASYGLQQFFLNGGSEAYVVRVHVAYGGKERGGRRHRDRRCVRRVRAAGDRSRSGRLGQ